MTKDENGAGASWVSKAFDLMHSVLDYGEALTVLALGGFRLSKPATVYERLAICDACEHNLDSECQLCGCRIGRRNWWWRWTSKVYFPRESCPDDRWRSE